MATRKTVKPGHVVESDAAPFVETGTALDDLQETESVYEPDMAPVAKTKETKKAKASADKPQASAEDSGAKGPDDNTPEDSAETEGDSGALELVLLKKGSTFRFREHVFKKDEPTAVEPEIAERLTLSGYFEKG